MVHAMFLHPDLGIGGAERLVVDAALSLKLKGHHVSFVTNHHDKNHCFTETTDGSFPVTVVGDWLPRSVFGYCHALCAYFRMLCLTLYMLLFIAPREHPDILICDQIPIGIPFSKLFGYKTLFYCHFPDLLLSVPGGNMKTAYRWIINWIEESAMDFADRILVNSLFTLGIFTSTFKNIHRKPDVLYPSINTQNFDNIAKNINISQVFPDLPRDIIVFLSINRYERKKNLALAIHALKAMEIVLSDAQFSRVHLVMMGGYDERITENIECFDELQQLCKEENLTSKITFLKSPSEEVKVGALLFCRCVLYTPSNEHFGIVPLEAMYAEKAVIAVQSGGPNETVDHEKTGYLTDPIPEYFAHYMAKLVTDFDLPTKLGEAGRVRFNKLFSFISFGTRLDRIITTVLTENFK